MYFSNHTHGYNQRLLSDSGGGINPCVYKAAAEGRGVGGGLGHCPAATHMVLLLAITGSPEHLPGGWFYNPYVLDEERRLVS